MHQTIKRVRAPVLDWENLHLGFLSGVMENNLSFMIYTGVLPGVVCNSPKSFILQFSCPRSNMTQTFNVKLARYYRTLITKSPTVGRVFAERNTSQSSLCCEIYSSK